MASIKAILQGQQPVPDTRPTKDSKKLITSGAVYNEITALNEALGSFGVTQTATGNPIIIDDGNGMPLSKATINIKPIQDLHGYSHPWVGGAGKNLLEITAESTTSNGVTFTVDRAAGTVTANGTASANTNFVLTSNDWIHSMAHLKREVIFSGAPEAPEKRTYLIQYYAATVESSIVIENGVESAPFVPTNENSLVRIVVYAGTTVNNVVFRPMIRLASETDDTFEPYANICPITGWDNITMMQAGKNLLELTEESATKEGVTFTINKATGTVIANGTAIPSSSQVNSVQLPLCKVRLPAGRYTLTGCPEGGDPNANGTYFLRVGYGNAEVTDVGTYFGIEVGNGFTFTADGETYYIVSAGIVKNYNASNITFRPMIRLASETDSTFEPYQGQTVSVSLSSAGTVYGGTLDVTTGKLTVDSAIDTLDGTITGTYTEFWKFNYFTIYKKHNDSIKWSMPIACSHYRNIEDVAHGNMVQIDGDNYIRIIDDAHSTFEELKAYFGEQFSAGNPVRVVYPLASPVTYQLTPQQISLLFSENILTTDRGNTMTITYGANPTRAYEKLQDALLSLGGNV